MIITYYRVFTDDDTDLEIKIIHSDKLENLTFMVKQISKNYILNFSIDRKNYFPITDSKGNSIVFNINFEFLLDMFYSHTVEYSHLTININEAFENIKQYAKLKENKED